MNTVVSIYAASGTATPLTLTLYNRATGGKSYSAAMTNSPSGSTRWFVSDGQFSANSLAAGTYDGVITDGNGAEYGEVDPFRWDGTNEILEAVPGDAMTLTAAERTASAGVFWSTLETAVTTASSIGLLLKTVLNKFSFTGNYIQTDMTQGTGTTGHTVGGQLDKAGTASTPAGSGAYSVEITVNDGTNLLQNAKVTLSEGVNSYTLTTGTNGQVSFSLDAATYTVAITKAGYTYSPTTLAVSDNTSVTRTMSVNTITPAADPTQTVLYTTTRDGSGNIAGSVDVNFTLVSDTSMSTGDSDSTATQTATSDATTGLLEFTAEIGRTYSVQRGDGPKYRVVAKDTGTQQLPHIDGSP